MEDGSTAYIYIVMYKHTGTVTDNITFYNKRFIYDISLAALLPFIT